MDRRLKDFEWVYPHWSADQRVLVGTNILINEPDPAALDVGPIGANYKEQIQWRELLQENYLQPRTSLVQ